MTQSTTQLAAPPLIDDVTVKDSFGDFCAGVNFTNGNVHLTFASITTDHSRLHNDVSFRRELLSHFPERSN
jgi:hypothetical protein